MTDLFNYFSDPAHYTPLCMFGLSLVEYLMGKTKHGSCWGLVENMVLALLKKGAGNA